MELYSLVTEARKLWDNDHSPYICDCLMSVVDAQTAEVDTTYPTIRPLLGFVKDDIQGSYSVYEHLFGKSALPYKLSIQQLKQAQHYREELWQRLFDYATELDHA